jgi:hypothetical protein
MTEHPPLPHFVIWRVVEASGTAGEPARCMTVDGRFSLDREDGESAADFERRAIGTAAMSGHRTMIMIPRPSEGAANGRTTP